MNSPHGTRHTAHGTRLAVIAVFALIGTWSNRASTQPITVTPVNPIPTGFTSHSSTGTVNVPCPDCNHDVTVSYDVTEGLITYVDGNGKTHQIIGCWFTFTNEDPTCSAHFDVCSMVQYVAPWIDENYYDPSVGGIDPYMVGHQTWQLTRNPRGAGEPCTYTCLETSSPSDPTTWEQHNYWSYYFGCKEVTLLPGQTEHAFDVQKDFDDVSRQAQLTDDVGTSPPEGVKTITLSEDLPNDADHSITTWNYNGEYTDIVEGCSIDPSTCTFAGSTNVEVDQNPNGSICANNGWHMINKVAPQHHPWDRIIGKVGFPVGNQVTMAGSMGTMAAFPAEFHGTLVGAPSGSELIVYAPVDTMGGMAVMDSGIIYTDTVSGCAADTLAFEFPFMIPPMDAGMQFELIGPGDSCSNVGNGHRIYLHGEVYANSTTSLYDSGAYMYWQTGTFVLDTTPPIITNFALHQVDSNKLEIRLTGVEDTTMIQMGWIEYSVNGGPQQILPLRFENNAMVGDTTDFLDTLVTSVGHPNIILKGFVENQTGLIDSSTVDTCHLIIAPASVLQGEQQSFKLLDFAFDRSSRSLTLDVQGDGKPITLDIVTEDGKLMPLTTRNIYSATDGHIVQVLPELAAGTYFIVIGNGEKSIVQRIVL